MWFLAGFLSFSKATYEHYLKKKCTVGKYRLFRIKKNFLTFMFFFFGPKKKKRRKMHNT